MKKTALLLFLAALILTAVSASARDMTNGIINGEIKVRSDYSIVVNGENVKPDVPPVEKGGLIFVPLRFVAEALGADVTWYKSPGTAEISYPGGRTVKMTVGDTTIDLGDTQKILPVAPFIFEKRTMIPLRPAAESGYFKVEEKPDASILTLDRGVKGYEKPGVESESPGKGTSGSLDMIRKKAHNDQVTKKLKPIVLAAWLIVGLLWIVRTALGLIKGKPEGWKDIVIIALFLSVGMFIVLNFMLSTYWAAIVILITSAIGLISTESYTDKLVTMASTAQGAGLICTLFGLGLLIGPAIAQRDIAAIGYGI